MKTRTIIFLCALTISSTVSWGQTWPLTPTMKATLTGGTLTISTTQNAEAMPDYDWNVPPPWDEIRDNIQTVVIEDKVTTIGFRAFLGCINMQSATIPASVTNIGDYAFIDCFDLASCTFPDALKTIGKEAFSNCRSLETITIPASVSLFSSRVMSLKM
jgi:hypothetical protein